MIAVFRAALLAALVAASTPPVAEGQEPSSDSLPHRIALLERKADELEQRIRELEALIQAEPSRDRLAPVSAKWRDLANWRRLRRRMTMDQVRALLGEPERVDAILFRTSWTWGTPPEARLDFDEDRLAGWSEPRR
jgi:hypothetical protein